MISLYETIDSHIRNLRSTLHTSIPATITKLRTEGEYISSVDVKPINNKVFEDGSVLESHTISRVPLVHPSSSEGIVSFPLKEGDTVLILIPHADIQGWVKNGTTGNPQTFRKFSLTDAVAIPCIHPTNSPVKAHKDNFQITFNDFTLSVTPSGKTSLTTKDNVVIDAKSSVQSYREAYSVDTNKVIIGNSNVDIVSYLSELTDEISKITVGGTPIDNKAAFESLKDKIDTLK